VNRRNALVICNDGSYDNWQGEYAVLLSHAGGPKLVGIVVNTSTPWPDLSVNIAGWRDLVRVARASGMEAPDPTPSAAPTLKRPANGDIDATKPNGSDGARRLLELSRQYGSPGRRLVVANGGRLTELADAYLMDNTVKDRIWVISSLGTASSSGASMGAPNGEEDPWADTIVAHRLQFIQVSSFYDQTVDVPQARIPTLPATDFGARMAMKQPNIYKWPMAADQVSVVAAAIPTFVVSANNVSAGAPVGANASAGPDLSNDPKGISWVVTSVSGQAVRDRIWSLLVPPTTAEPLPIYTSPVGP